MNKQFLDCVEQKFNTQADAQQFISIMGKYINPEQITVEGTKVSVKANNRGESWFLLFFSLLVACKKAGVETPSVISQSVTLLATHLKEPADADKPTIDEMIDDLENRGITQSQILEMIADLSC